MIFYSYKYHNSKKQDPDKRSIIECLLNGTPKGEKYCESVRMFAFNMRFLSPRSYEYLRSKFDNNLPHSTTIRKWFSLSNASGDGGLNGAAFETLKKIGDDFKKEGKSIYCAISLDEMSIRRHVQWQHYKKKFSGFVNFATKQNENDPLPVATNAIVVLLNGINVHLTIPIAYFFITTLISEEKAILVAAILKALTDIGLEVVTVTWDGLSTNSASAEILGASFKHDNIIPYIINPDSGRKVYFIHDPPHMLKLFRNCLGDQKILHDRDGRTIEWKFIERLYRSKENELASNKLTRKHIDWKASPMNVKLAAQTLSMSVSESINRLRLNGLKQFAGSEGTTDFIARVNNLFDIFNSDKFVKGNILKTPINAESKLTIFSFLDDMIDYLDGVTLKGQAAITSTRYTPFKGFKGRFNLENDKMNFYMILIIFVLFFKANIIALKFIYQELVETKFISELRTTSIQQDLLESFFGRMRSGNNNNPTVEQFSANFRRTVINTELTSSSLANCIDNLDILKISSQHTIDPSAEKQIFVMTAKQALSIDNETEEEELPEDFAIPNHADSGIPADLGIANVAGIIESSIERNRKFNCEECSFIFEKNEKMDANLFIRNKKNVIPCKSTFDICKVSNVLSSIHESNFMYPNLVTQIKNQLKEDLYNETCFEHNVDHKTFIIDLIIEEFIRIRATHRARQLTLDQHKKFVRHGKTHDVTFSGQ